LNPEFISRQDTMAQSLELKSYLRILGSYPGVFAALRENILWFGFYRAKAPRPQSWIRSFSGRHGLDRLRILSAPQRL
jgi:hypothetical protein